MVGYAAPFDSQASEDQKFTFFPRFLFFIIFSTVKEKRYRSENATSSVEGFSSYMLKKKLLDYPSQSRKYSRSPLLPHLLEKLKIGSHGRNLVLELSVDSSYAKAGNFSDLHKSTHPFQSWKPVASFHFQEKNIFAHCFLFPSRVHSKFSIFNF